MPARRWFCHDCKREWLFPEYHLGVSWEPTDGCPAPDCHSLNIELVTFTPATVGLDIPRETLPAESQEPIKVEPQRPALVLLPPPEVPQPREPDWTQLGQ